MLEQSTRKSEAPIEKTQTIKSESSRSIESVIGIVGRIVHELESLAGGLDAGLDLVWVRAGKLHLRMSGANVVDLDSAVIDDATTFIL
jgi:hypothetical protein